MLINTIMISLIILTVLFTVFSDDIEFYEDDKFNGDDNVYSFDQVFRDVKTYPNDNSYHLTPNFQNGISKCEKDCKGYCVQRGETGIAYCFPP